MLGFGFILLGVCAAPVLGDAPIEDTVVPEEQALPPAGAVSDSLQTKVTEAVEEEAQRDQWLEGKVAAEEREASATAFSNETRAEAANLLESSFEDALEGLKADPARTLSALTVEDVLAPNAARIADQDGSGGSELIETSVPVATRVLNGAPQPIDLSLRQVGDFFVAENPLTAVSLPSSADGRVDIGGITISDLPGDGASQASRLGDMDLFYPETATDTDTLIAPVSSGLEVFDQLRSAESPEELRFQLDLPTGARIISDGQRGAQVTLEGQVLANVPVPLAFDAQGTEVPVQLRIDGQDLVLEVAHRTMDVAYPILVDPAFLTETLPESYGHWGFSPPSASPEYPHSMSTGNIHVHSRGEEVEYQAGSYGHYYLSPPGSTSYVSGASFGWTTYQVHNCYTQQPHGYVGIANTNGTWPSIGVYSGGDSSSSGFSTGWTGGPGTRWAIVGVSTTTWSKLKCAHELDVGGASVTFDDNDAPWLGTPSVPSGAVGKKPATLTVPTSDSGLGVAVVTVQGTDSAGEPITWRALPAGREDCGIWAHTCLESWTGGVTIEPKWLPEGSIPLNVSVKDAVDNWTGPKTVWITVDHTPPVTTIDSGPEAGGAIAGPTATFTFHANKTGSTFECRIVGVSSFAGCSGSGYTTPSLSQGRQEFQVRATDSIGNEASNATTRVFYVGPPDTIIDSGPQSLTNDETPRFEYHADYQGSAASANFECRIDGAAFASCPAGSFTSAQLADGAHSFEVRATKNGLPDPSPAKATFTLDTVPPQPDIVGGPTGPTNQTTPTFTFSKEAGATVECSIDTGSPDFGGCSGPTSDKPGSALPQETYYFRVLEEDAAGNPNTAKRVFTVDTVPPQTTIESGPHPLASNPFPHFSFESSEREAGFECEVDATGEQSCAGDEYVTEELSDGTHTVYVSAMDEAGNVDPSPASRTFSVDTTLPGATIESGPTGTTTDKTPTFTFQADANADVECALDPAGESAEPDDFRQCTTPTTDTAAAPLADGRYSFNLLVTDPAENEDTLARHFTVDTAPPDTTINWGPEGATDDPKPTFGFGANENKTKFECRIDGASYASCSGPSTTHTPATTLADGEHTFSVRAIDAAGSVDPTAATSQFTVDTKKPQTTIQSGPEGPTLDKTPSFAYSASEPGSFQCKVDTASFTGCPTASVEIASVPDGQHTLAVRALDEAHNPDPTPAQRTFVVDTTIPTEPEASGDLTEPGKPGVGLDVQLRDGSAASPQTRQSGMEALTVRVDGQAVYSDEMPCVGAFHTCPDVLNRSLELPYQNVIGNHVYKVEGEDALGNKAVAREWLEHTPSEDTLMASSSGVGKEGCGPVSKDGVRPDRDNQTLRGGPGDDLIVVNESWVKTVMGKDGCDVIIGGYGKEVIRGGAGADLIRANRSNDVVFGEDGADEIFGGIGDDELHGNQGNDYIDGGPGADEEHGEADDDSLRGGQGIDQLAGGGGGTDTVVFADGVGPGWNKNGAGYEEVKSAIAENIGGVAQFPSGVLRTGVFVNLNGPENGGDDHRRRNYAFNGGGPNGGGMDYLYIPQGKNPPGQAKVEESGDFEKVVGSAFADLIRGSGQAENIAAGPGPDVVRSGGGADKISGGSEGDFLDGSGTAVVMTGGVGDSGAEDRCVNPGPAASVEVCSSAEDTVKPRQPANSLAIGIQQPEAAQQASNPFKDDHANLFVDGSPGNDHITVSYPDRKHVEFTVNSPADEIDVNGCSIEPPKNSKTHEEPKGHPQRKVKCFLEGSEMGSVVMVGGDGEDTFDDGGLDRERPGSVLMLGGDGRDELNGSNIDELLLDGSNQGGGQEKLIGGGGDDVLIQGDGKDWVEGGNNNDLLMTSKICEHDSIYGDAHDSGDTGSDNAQFHPENEKGVFANLTDDHLGETNGPGSSHKCSYGSYDPLKAINDLEGSPKGDIFEGDGHHNLLLGRGGADVLKGLGGNDTLNARDGARDNVINCGNQDGDIAHLDGGERVPPSASDDKKEAEKHCPPDNIDFQGEMYPLSALEGMMAEDESGLTFAVALAAPKPAPLGEYPLDESSGSVAANIVEEGEDGQYRFANPGDDQGPTLQAEGALLTGSQDTGVELDGSNDYVELGAAPEPSEEPEELGDGGMSIELWVNFDQAPTEKEYLYSAMEEGEGPFLYRDADGNIVFGTHTEAGSPEVITAEPIEDGEWHQVVGTLEGEEIALYVDGFPHRMGYGQPVLPEAPEEEGKDEEPTEVVGTSSGMSHFLDGTIDDVVVYEGAVEQGEVVNQLATSKAEEPEVLLAPEPETSDVDSDGVPDGIDNCPEVSNEAQTDEDLDGTGDACLHPDSDGDEVFDTSDDCVDVYNPAQTDRDGDSVGTECDENEPALRTEPASGVAATAATMNAAIDPEGEETTYYFEYGTSTSYGLKAPAAAQLAGIEAGEEPVSNLLTGLEPSTTYHYRVVAISEGGSAVAGEDQAFTTKAAVDIAAKLGTTAVIEPFDATSTASFSANWAPLGWAGGSSPKGAVEASGWHPVDAYSTVNGAYYNQSVNDSGWGTGVATTMAANPANASRYFSLWLDMPSPSSTSRGGYELRFTYVSAGVYNVTLSKWANGTQTQLASKASYGFVNGNSFALVDNGGTVSAWTDTGSGYSQIMSAADNAYEGGKVGVEGSGNITRLKPFRAGSLRRFSKAATETATAVGTAQATLNGVVNPEGEATSYWFQYGPTASYGSNAPAAPIAAGSGSTNLAVSESLKELEPGTTYHYRLVAESEAGISYGEDRALTTLEVPRAASDAATAVKVTQATLNGTVNPNGSAASYNFEWGQTPAYGFSAPGSPASAGAGSDPLGVEHRLVNLTSGATYHYRLVATSAAGTSYGDDQVFETRADVGTGNKLAGLPVIEPFDATSTASFSANWAPLGWAGGSSPKGAVEASGWHPVDAYSTVNGAYYNQSVNDSGWGTGVATTMAANPANASRYFSLWLDMPSPSSTSRGGYELRFTYVSAGVYNVTLSKWANGTQTQLASKASYGFVTGNSFALVDNGGTVSAWTDTGSGYSQIMSAADNAYEGGKVGVEGSGNITRLKPFRAGVLNFPKAITEAAGAVKGTSATLNATVDPEAEATTYQFEYGPTTAYGSKAPASAAAAGSGIGGVAVSETIGGLTQSTTYHYRVVAGSPAGTSYGEDRTFTTLNAPKVTTGFASAVKATTATLEGAVEPQGSPTTYQFEYGLTTSYGSTAPASPASAGSGTGSVPVNQALTGLSEGATYHYRLVAVNDGGTTYGEDKTLTTLKLPKATTSAASAVKASTATLNASLNPEGSATTYQFEYGLTTSYGSTAPASPASAGTGTTNVAVSEAIGGLSQGTTYHYRLVATSVAGTTYGGDKTLTTLKVPKATTGSASAVKATTATLNASINPEGAFTTYQFEYGPTASYGSKVPASSGFAGLGNSPVEVSQTATNLSPGTTYHYRVVASSEAGTAYGEDKTFAAASFETGAQLPSLPVVESFNGSSTSVANFGSGWAALGWAGGSTPKGADEASGWRPVDAYSTVNGAYYNQALNDLGWGVGTAVTLGNNPEIEARYFSLWLDMPSPTATTRAGYELRFTNTAANLYTVTLSKWIGGTQTQLGSKTGYTFVNSNSLALVDMGGTVSAWTNAGSGYTQLLSAADTTYEGGKAGVEGSGNITRLTNFKASQLKLLPKPVTEAATNVKMGQATLNASVNPQGTPTTYQIEYGTSMLYGSKVPASPAAVGSGNSPVAVAQTVTTLEAGTIYHYRVVGTSEAGTAYGEDKTVTTPPAPSYLTSFGTAGTGNGQFAHPAGIAIDGAGNIWVVDENNARVEKFGPGGEYLAKFGSTGSGDGQFNRPTDIAIDPKGNLWVTDAGNNRVQKFGPSGEFLAKFGSNGSGNGQFSGPESLAVDSKGNVWVADTYNGRVQKFSETGEFLKVVGSAGTGQGQIVEATGIDIGLGGTVWVADWGNQKILEFSESGEFIRQFGSEGTGNGQFKRPDVIEVDSKGRVWVGDQNNARIQRFTEAGTYMSQFGTAGSGAGQFSFGWPMGIASDGSGNLWIADTGNNRVQKWG